MKRWNANSVVLRVLDQTDMAETSSFGFGYFIILA